MTIDPEQLRAMTKEAKRKKEAETNAARIRRGQDNEKMATRIAERCIAMIPEIVEKAAQTGNNIVHVMHYSDLYDDEPYQANCLAAYKVAAWCKQQGLKAEVKSGYKPSVGSDDDRCYWVTVTASW